MWNIDKSFLDSASEGLFPAILTIVAGALGWRVRNRTSKKTSDPVEKAVLVQQVNSPQAAQYNIVNSSIALIPPPAEKSRNLAVEMSAKKWQDHTGNKYLFAIKISNSAPDDILRLQCRLRIHKSFFPPHTDHGAAITDPQDPAYYIFRWSSEEKRGKHGLLGRLAQIEGGSSISIPGDGFDLEDGDLGTAVQVSILDSLGKLLIRDEKTFSEIIR